MNTHTVVAVLSTLAALSCGAPTQAPQAPPLEQTMAGCVDRTVDGHVVCMPTDVSWKAFTDPVTVGSPGTYFGRTHTQWAPVSFVKDETRPTAWVVHPPAEFVATVLPAASVQKCRETLQRRPGIRCRFTSTDKSLQLLISSNGNVEVYLSIEGLSEALGADFHEG